MISGPLCFGQRSIWRSIRTNPLVDGIRSQLTSLLGLAGSAGIADQRVSKLVLEAPKVTQVTSVNGNSKK